MQSHDRDSITMNSFGPTSPQTVSEVNFDIQLAGMYVMLQ